MIPLGCFLKPPWQANESVGRFLEALANTFPEVRMRLVGGAVRETLLGRFSAEHDDLDFAVDTTPEKFSEMCLLLGVQSIPTGIKFGTISILINSKMYEVTSLRRDVSTDGRHPVVCFSKDWGLDAERRDFTVNALYADWDGTYYDPLGSGVEDLEKQQLIFIGNAEARIREDYLRIIRFFRFMGAFDSGSYNNETLRVCLDMREGLESVSYERKWSELCKIFQSCYPIKSLSALIDSGLIGSVCDLDWSLENLQQTIPWVQGMLRGDVFYGVLGGIKSAEILDSAIPRKIQKRLNVTFAAKINHQTIDIVDIYRLGKNLYKDVYLLHAMLNEAYSDEAVSAVLSRFEAVDNFKVPKLPITGQDLLLLGVASGPLLGSALRNTESWWLKHKMSHGKDACLEYALEQYKKFGEKNAIY